MVQRHSGSTFGSAYAFPGGVVDDVDRKVADFCGGFSNLDANLRLGVEGGGLSYYSAAIRELFEETGVLLADFGQLDQDLAAIRAALNNGSLDWDEFLSNARLTLHCDQLHYFSHWITPSSEPRRYSTRFFLAVMPDGQVAEHCGGELTASCWATPADILAAERRGDLNMIFPTIKTLESVARHKTLQDLVEWARSSVDWGITTMVPLMIKRDGKDEIVLPGDKDYPGAKS
jgi:8-oxo-dGTP pyrophosphatase MutT (NUDIX family)